MQLEADSSNDRDRDDAAGFLLLNTLRPKVAAKASV